MNYRIEYNDFVSNPDDCVTTIATKVFTDPEEAAELGWQLMANLASVLDAEIENQGDQFMVAKREEDIDQESEGGVLFTLRILDENGEPFDL